MVYRLNGEILGEVPILAGESVEKAEFLDYLKKLWKDTSVSDNIIKKRGHKVHERVFGPSAMRREKIRGKRR